MDDIKSLGDIIRKCRKIKGLTQEELARKSGLSTMSIRRYENGERLINEKIFSRIADVLGIPADLILHELQIETTHLACGVHIYRNELPWGVDVSVLLNDYPEESYDVAYRDRNTIIVVDKDSTISNNELEEIIHEYRHLGMGFEIEFDPIYYSDKRNRESKMISAFNKLNYKGQQKAVERVEELTEIPRYQYKNAKPDTPDTPQDTTAPQNAVDAPQGGSEVE